VTGRLALESPGFAMGRVTALFTEVGVPFEQRTAGELATRFPALDAGRHYPPRALADEEFWADPTARSAPGGPRTAATSMTRS
jgi:hypothetical protein